MTDSPLSGYLAARETLLSEHEPGSDAAAALARLTDEAVTALTVAASSAVSAPVAVLALGGYGAGRLLPSSDIDLLVVCDAPESRVRAFTEPVLYPFWDAGFSVGHQVRSRRGHLQATREDLTVLAATLTARIVAGDDALGRRTLRDVFTAAGKRLDRIAARMRSRDRPGTPYDLEPDLKEGAGGQRDIDELVWLASLYAGRPVDTLLALEERGLLTRNERLRVVVAQDALTAARWRLHATRSARPNLLSLGAAVDAAVPASSVQEALIDTHHVLLNVRDRITGTERNEKLWDAPALLNALREGPTRLPDLHHAAWRGDLEELVPGLRVLMHLRRPGLGHRLTVGAHSLEAASLVRSLSELDPLAADVIGQLEDDRVTLVAALAHDLGKTEGGPGHADRGAEMVPPVARRLGLSATETRDVETLVREHLLLARTATGSDLGDEDVILRTAARLGKRELIAPLFLLAVADAVATGPDTWTPVRAALVRELTAKLDDALSPEIDGAGIISAATAVRGEATRRARSVGAERAVLRFVEEAPLRYLARRSVDDVLRHARFVRSTAGPRGTAIELDVTPGAAPNTWDVLVVTRDRPGLFSTVCGVMALSGLDIHAAEAFTESSGIVLDVLTVGPASLAPVGETTWDRVRSTAARALEGELDVHAALAEQRAYHRSATDTWADVSVDAGHALSTIVRVRTPDRLGLLHDLAGAFAATDLDVRLAVAESQDGIASDVFHVVGPDGTPPTDEILLAELESRLREAASP